MVVGMTSVYITSCPRLADVKLPKYNLLSKNLNFALSLLPVTTGNRSDVTSFAGGGAATNLRLLLRDLMQPSFKRLARASNSCFLIPEFCQNEKKQHIVTLQYSAESRKSKRKIFDMQLYQLSFLPSIR